MSVWLTALTIIICTAIVAAAFVIVGIARAINTDEQEPRTEGNRRINGHDH